MLLICLVNMLAMQANGNFIGRGMLKTLYNRVSTILLLNLIYEKVCIWSVCISTGSRF